MIPSKNHPQWAPLIEGHLNCKFSHAAASMLLIRLQNDVKQGTSPNALLKATDELHTFFTKYEQLLESEIKVVFH